MRADLAESVQGDGRTRRAEEEGRAGGGIGAPTGGEAGAPTITFRAGDMHHDMRYRLGDVGVCHLLEDARDGGCDLVLVGKNIFRKDEKRPLIDEIIVPNTGLVEGLTRGA